MNKAQVIKQLGKQFLIEDNSQRYIAFARKKATKAVCGDWVEYHQDKQQVIIDRVLPRSNVLSRSGFRQQVKPIAANLSQICIVSAPFPGIHSEMIDRYIIAAVKLSLNTILVFNKMDLLDKSNEQKKILEDLIPVYQKLEIPVLSTSTQAAESIAPLLALLENQTSIFAGESGVGKSSLIQKILPELDLKIGNLSENTQLGKHTTTHSELFHLPTGGKVIDSPGVRSFDVSHFEKEDIHRGFKEIYQLSQYCQYNNCTHIAEPANKCAVKQALEENKVAASRYHNYQKIYQFESDYAD